MKTIPLAQALEILGNAAATIVDGSCVTYPQLIDDEPECDVVLSVETNFGHKQFIAKDNETVEIDNQGQIVMFNTQKRKTTFMPLVAQPVK